MTETLEQKVARLEERLRLNLEAEGDKEKRAFVQGFLEAQPAPPNPVTRREAAHAYRVWRAREESEGINRTFETGREP